VKEMFLLERQERPWVVQACSAKDKDSIAKGFTKLNKLLISPSPADGEFHSI